MAQRQEVSSSDTDSSSDESSDDDSSSEEEEETSSGSSESESSEEEEEEKKRWVNILDSGRRVFLVTTFGGVYGIARDHIVDVKRGAEFREREAETKSRGENVAMVVVERRKLTKGRTEMNKRRNIHVGGAGIKMMSELETQRDVIVDRTGMETGDKTGGETTEKEEGKKIHRDRIEGERDRMPQKRTGAETETERVPVKESGRKEETEIEGVPVKETERKEGTEIEGEGKRGGDVYSGDWYTRVHVIILLHSTTFFVLVLIIRKQ